MKTKIRLQVSQLLNGRFKLDTEGLEEKRDALLVEWNKQEDKIVDGLTQITGLTFLRNYIDVFLIKATEGGSISFPLIVKVSEDDSKTMCVIVHELIHNIMWDNNEKDNWSSKVRKLYPLENKKTAIHVAVHAILEAVYVDILKKLKDIVKVIEDSQKFPDYKRAWEIVKEEGYKNIIAKLRK